MSPIAGKAGPHIYEITFLAEFSDDALLNELRRIASLLSPDEKLTKGSFKRHRPKVAVNTIQRRFGSWKEALERAGIIDLYSGVQISRKMREQHGKSFSNDDVVREMKRIANLVDEECLTVKAFNAYSSIDAGVVRRRFGSFRNGLNAAGLQSHPPARRTLADTQCFENLAEVWTHYGRAPQYREMFRPPSTIQGKTYVTRWRTWRNALIKFADWADTSADMHELQVHSAVGGQLPLKPVVRKLEADIREVRPGLRFKIFRRDNFRCVACGRSPATHLNIELHADHITAVARGGQTTIENLQTLCSDCNLGKGKN